MNAIPTETVPLHFHDSGVVPGRVGPPLVLIHGWTCDSHDWVFQLADFESHSRVITPDLRGHGRSPVTDSGYSTLQFAADVAALMRDLAIGPAVVVGHSLGGVVAASLAVQWPELVCASVVVEPAYGMDAESLDFLRAASARFGDRAGSELAAELIAATEPATEEWLKIWHRRHVLEIPARVMKQAFDGMYVDPQQVCGQPQTDEFLVRRSTPTLAFHRFPHMAEWERSTFRHEYSRAVSWEGGGHWLHQQRPREFNDVVLAWIDGLPTQGSEVRDAMVSSTAGDLRVT